MYEAGERWYSYQMFAFLMFLLGLVVALLYVAGWFLWRQGMFKGDEVALFAFLFSPISVPFAVIFMVITFSN